MIMQKKLERRRRRRGTAEEIELKEQYPPGETSPMDKSPSPVDSPHVVASAKYSPASKSPHGQRIISPQEKEPQQQPKPRKCVELCM